MLEPNIFANFLASFKKYSICLLSISLASFSKLSHYEFSNDRFKKIIKKAL